MTLDTFIFILIGLVAIGMAAFGGHLSSQRRGYRFTFWGMGLASAALVIWQGLRVQESAKEAKREGEKLKTDLAALIVAQGSHAERKTADEISRVIAKLDENAPQDSLRRKTAGLSRDIMNFVNEREEKALHGFQPGQRLTSEQTTEVLAAYSGTVKDYHTKFDRRVEDVLSEIGAQAHIDVSKLRTKSKIAKYIPDVESVANEFGILASMLPSTPKSSSTVRLSREDPLKDRAMELARRLKVFSIARFQMLTPPANGSYDDIRGNRQIEAKTLEIYLNQYLIPLNRISGELAAAGLDVTELQKEISGPVNSTSLGFLAEELDKVSAKLH